MASGKSKDSTRKSDTEIHPANLTVDERVWRLERDLKDAKDGIDSLKNKPKLWKDRSFYTGIFALPLLVLTGWVLTYVGGASDSRFFQPLPYIHSMFGTEEAVRAYVAPNKKRDKRGDVDAEISEIVELSYANKIDAYISDKDLLTLEGLLEAIGEGKLDKRIRGVGGRKQNFNDFFINRLGLQSETAEYSGCDDVPIGAEVLELEVEAQRRCYLISGGFSVSDGFTILRPKDVRKVRLEIFVVSEVANGADDAGITFEAFTVPGDIRTEFLEVRVNAELALMANPAVEGTFANGVDAYKFVADFETPPENDFNDRSYDIMTVSINLLNYDMHFGSDRRDKAFTVFVVPTFITG